MELHNLGQLPAAAGETFIDGGMTKYLSRLAGSQKLYVNIDVVPPGACSSKYHAHSLQEEFFLILQGEGTLRTKEGERPVKTGDFMAKPAGFANPHQFRNTGSAPLEILDVGTLQPGDVAYYPDEDTYLLRGEGLALRGQKTPAFTSEPAAEKNAP